MKLDWPNDPLDAAFVQRYCRGTHLFRLASSTKFHEIPAHHRLDEYLDAYLAAGAFAQTAALPSSVRSIESGSFRATGITAYMLNGETLEHAQQIAAHESPRPTKIYDRTRDEITLDEIERILI